MQDDVDLGEEIVAWIRWSSEGRRMFNSVDHVIIQSTDVPQLSEGYDDGWAIRDRFGRDDVYDDLHERCDQ